eukprot:7218244-Prorocentrum_lima.AAC.1
MHGEEEDYLINDDMLDDVVLSSESSKVKAKMRDLQLSRFSSSDFLKSDPAMVNGHVKPRAAAKSKGRANPHQ